MSMDSYLLCSLTVGIKKQELGLVNKLIASISTEKTTVYDFFVCLFNGRTLKDRSSLGQGWSMDGYLLCSLTVEIKNARGLLSI